MSVAVRFGLGAFDAYLIICLLLSDVYDSYRNDSEILT